MSNTVNERLSRFYSMSDPHTVVSSNLPVITRGILKNP